MSVVVFGLVLCAGVTFGSLLGVFRLGLLSRRRVADGANVLAMVLMALVDLALLVLSETKILAFAWSWLVILGTAGTIVLALAFSRAAGGGIGGAETPVSQGPPIRCLIARDGRGGF